MHIIGLRALARKDNSLLNIKEESKANYKKILMLTIATAVLAVMASGNALAYSYSNVEWSVLTSDSVTYTSEATGNPSVSAGDQLTWQNTLVNGRPNSYYYPRFEWSGDLQSSSFQSSPSGLSYNYAWCPDGSVNAGSSSGTWTVTHWYCAGQDMNYGQNDKQYC
ncbi:hypothetical protein [Methanocella arvoryzae]|uniref:Uncharacterized protein n=1 Tax=Methanocella arvoryzae (strain DSM 22066 / NBRC 105507 / MRE50) TaxID=351160 RepID=Q0W5R1_METAR|nr:hypothetical protein [Methanocella arvoryzae]CAJ36282.1 hypothetical protein RCIA54 [Methanocella arvoryzae MRE50]